jgi:DNA-binding winged helix-turn-helix (wHTH) protein
VLRNGYDEVIRKILGDVSRMTTYAKKGYQTHHDIPEDIQLAYDIMLDRNH